MKTVYGVIYKHTNKSNPTKCYIGQTTAKPDRRFRKSNTDYRGYKSCKAFYNALKAHTWNGFTTEILCECYSQEELNKMEEFYIKKFNSIAPNGYNLNSIIEGSVKLSDQTKKRISEKKHKYYASLTVPVEGPNKKRHEIINGIAHKECYLCKEKKPLAHFGKFKTRWDGLNSACKPCHNKRKSEVQPYIPLSEDKWKASYEKRKQSFSEGQKRRFQDPLQVKKVSESNSKPIIATCISTLKKMEFSSALAAKEKGFHNVNIGKAIKSGKPYKGYYWKKA